MDLQLHERGQSFSSEAIDVPTQTGCKPWTWLTKLRKFLLSDWEGEQIEINEITTENELKSRGDTMRPGFSQYDDFQTIDWVRDSSKDRLRQRNVLRSKRLSVWRSICALCDASVGWVCVCIVGVLCGCVAAFIDIGTSWLGDLKEGHCSEGFWFNREQCCWSSNSSFFIEDDCEEWVTWPELMGYPDEEGAENYGLRYLMFVLWAIGMAVTAACFVRTFAPYAGGGGIPELKSVLSGFIIRGLLGKWTLIIKVVGVMLAVGSGLVLGKEGPLVHIACCIGNIVSRLFSKYRKNEAKKREILSAAAAAGVAVAFGAPIGGVLFSLEEVSYYFPLKTLWRTFFCSLVAAFYTTPWIFVELLPFVLLGVMGGALATVFIKANVYWCRIRKTTKLGQFPILEVFVIVLITAALSFPNPYTRLDNNQLIATLVRDCRIGHSYDLCDYVQANGTNEFNTMEAGPGIERASWQLILALIFKLTMMTVTVGMKIPAGLYIPSLAIGAIMGRLVGIAMESLLYNYPYLALFEQSCGVNCITPGLYAMVGAAAFLGGVTRMTVGLVVIMFEVTGGVRYILPVMLAVMTSKWVGDGLCKQGIFEALIDLNDYPFLDSKEEFHHATLAADVMHPKNGEPGEPFTVLIQDGMTVGKIEDILIEYPFNGFPVVVSIESQYLVGFVLRRDLVLALQYYKKRNDNITPDTEVTFVEPLHGSSMLIRLHKIVDSATITITDATPMETVIDMFKKLGLRHVLVTLKGRLLGIITKKDVLRHLKKHEP